MEGENTNDAGANVAAGIAKLTGGANAAEPVNPAKPPATSPTATTAPAAAEAAKPTADYVLRSDVDKMVKDGIAAAFNQQSSQRDAENNRERFIRDKMNDLPAIYQNQMPKTGDPRALAKAEQDIRDQYKRDFRASGGTVPNISGNVSTGHPPMATFNPKLTPSELVAEGLKKRATSSDYPEFK